MKVLVTGSTRGLGLELLRAFVLAGHNVVMNGRNEVNTYFEAIWDDALNISGNDLKKLGVDVVVNNAFDKQQVSSSLITQLNVLLSSATYFKSIERGVIININSVAAIDGKDSEYDQAKCELRKASKFIKIGCWRRGVNIIDVYPGAIKTEWTKDRPDWNDLIDPQELAAFIVNLVKPSTFYVDEVIIRRPKC